jgi:hypothetical protein
MLITDVREMPRVYCLPQVRARLESDPPNGRDRILLQCHDPNRSGFFEVSLYIDREQVYQTQDVRVLCAAFCDALVDHYTAFLTTPEEEGRKTPPIFPEVPVCST